MYDTVIGFAEQHLIHVDIAQLETVRGGGNSRFRKSMVVATASVRVTEAVNACCVITYPFLIIVLPEL
jgi:hypothetical protein